MAIFPTFYEPQTLYDEHLITVRMIPHTPIIGAYQNYQRVIVYIHPCYKYLNLGDIIT